MERRKLEPGTIASPSMALANWNGWSKNFRFIPLLSQFLTSPTLHTIPVTRVSTVVVGGEAVFETELNLKVGSASFLIVKLAAIFVATATTMG